MRNKLLILGLLISLSTTGLSTAIAQELIPETVAQADSAFPSDVENLKATAADGKIVLSWDTATDNVGVTGYKIFYGTNSVTDDNASYTEGPVDVGNVISYEVDGLTNGTTYFFAITAYDAAGNESEFYSNEASATPMAGLGENVGTDIEAPKVVSATAITKNKVRVTFSEKVVLPSNSPEASFNIKEDLSGINLSLNNAEIDSADLLGRTVLLTTADQAVGVNYVLTAGLEIKDVSGNPIVSGTSDTATFVGSALLEEELKPVAETDSTAPSFVNVQALNSTTVEVTFSEPVVLKADARDNFIVNEVMDPNQIVEIEKVTLDGSGMKATLTTMPMSAKQYNLIGLQLLDASGNEMDIANSGTTFTGVEGEVVIPTETETPGSLVEQAAMDLMAKAMSNMAVQLSWGANEEKLANIANFMVYMSTDRGATYGEGVSLDTAARMYDFQDLQEGMVYYFKLTSRNAAGQESDPIITYMTLPKTGPGLALLLLGSAGAGAFVTRKKKK
ncbi:MAG: fibronectin type III domain-containing protein [Candidatus Altimarinota bacterium]